MAVTTRLALAAGGFAVGLGLLTAATMAPASADGALLTAAPAGGCGASAHIDAQWGSGATGGEIVTVTVVNTSSTTATRWMVTWTLAAGQSVLTAWNATVTTSGILATAVNAPYNGVLAPGASTTFGMELVGTGPVPVPSCANDVPVPPGSGSPSATTPVSGADVTVTQADSQRTVTLVVGQTLGVSLGADFRTPAVSGPALAPVSVTGGYGTGQPLVALYRAVAPGAVDVSSQTDYACLHTSPPCALPITLWTVHVNVVAGPTGTGQTVTVSVTDNQSTVSLHVGDRLEVSLPSEYDPVTVAPGGVLALSDSAGGYPTGRPLVAHYLAVAPGQVDMSTVTDRDCLHVAPPCPTPQIPWTVHVTVTS